MRDRGGEEEMERKGERRSGGIINPRGRDEVWREIESTKRKSERRY